MIFNFQGTDTDFRDIFYIYASDREGYRTDVYKDIKGNLTVGIGHLVTAADGLQYRDEITDQQVLQFFYDDYERLKIQQFVDEAGITSYNQGLAIAHFIWGHGYGQYENSQLRQHIINGDLDYNGMINYLNSNWDLKSKSGQKVNDYDFGVYYSANDWIPAKSLDYYIAQIKSFVNNNITSVAYRNPTETVLIVTGVVVAVSSYIYLALKNKK